MSFGTALASTRLKPVMGLGVAATTAVVGALVRDPSMPSSSLSETVTLRVLPTWAATGGYSLLSALSISAPERSHWYSNTASAMPSAEAMSLVDAVRVSPTWAVPVIVGVPVAGLLAPSTVVPVSVHEFLVGEDEGPGLFHVVQVDCDHGRIALPVRLRCGDGQVEPILCLVVQCRSGGGGQQSGAMVRWRSFRCRSRSG